jgi:hypothetical protein
MPKVTDLMADATTAVERLRESATSAEALASLVEAANTITEFGDVDRRAREYLDSNLDLMAADVVYAEGGETATAAKRRVEAASVAEHQAFDAFEAAERLRELYALAAAAGIGAFTLLLFALTPRRPSAATEEDTTAATSGSPGELLLRDIPAAPAPARETGGDLPRRSTAALKSTASLCTEFGRLRDHNDLTKLLAQAADLIEASGLIVWLGNTNGADLRPVLAHGYPPQTLARMPLVPRTADNAAAAAYRTGSLQIVLARPGQSSGAIVAPLLSPEGCIGALTAEIRGGGETSDTVHALAAIVAAQLAGILAPSAPQADAPPRAANL